MRPILALDTETDGLGWSRQAWELAFVKRWPDGNTVERSWFLDIDLRRADPKALECMRIWDAIMTEEGA